MMRTVSQLRASVSVAVALLFAVSCGQQPTDPTEDSAIPAGQAQLLLAVNTAATSIATLAVEVTAPDIATPLIFNIEESGGTAIGTLTIPAGSDRTITVRAFDSNGIETHRGSITIDVVEGANPSVSIALLPLTGEQQVDASFGSFAVIVNPPSTVLEVGETAPFTATVFDADGNATGDAVAWASANPGVASVDGGGLVTGNAEGSTVIVATFNGVGGSALVDVVAAIVPQGPVYPPPGGVDFTTAGSSMGEAGGATFEFSNFDISVVTGLAWGADVGAPIGVAFDGTVDVEIMTLDLTNSDLPGGVLRWTGSADFTSTDVNGNFVTQNIPTRFTVTVATPTGALFFLDPSALGLAPEIGGLAPIEENYPSGGPNTPFGANLLMEAFFNNVWTPAADLFNSLNTPPNAAVETTFTGGFYFMP